MEMANRMSWLLSLRWRADNLIALGSSSSRWISRDRNGLQVRRNGLVPRLRLRHQHSATRQRLLHAGRRQAVDRGQAPRYDPFDTYHPRPGKAEPSLFRRQPPRLACFHDAEPRVVAPGIFPTSGASTRLYPDPAEYEAQVARIPVGRVRRHAELANLCSYLMSEYASLINGDCITMDGGAGLVEGGGGTVQYLHSWGPKQWEEFRARAATTVASSSNKA